MKKELDEQLCKKYPKIFRDRYAPMTQTAMSWGFDCGDGWYDIIDALCGSISNHLWNQRHNRISAMRYNRVLKRAINGNVAALERYYYKGTEEESIAWAKKMAARDLEVARTGPNQQFRKEPPKVRQVVASQVKEKYGTLRFYTNGNDEYVDGLISMAESMSARTCETCGSPGKTRRGGWVRTLCDKHAEEQGYIENSDED